MCVALLFAVRVCRYLNHCAQNFDKCLTVIFAVFCVLSSYMSVLTEQNTPQYHTFAL